MAPALRPRKGKAAAGASDEGAGGAGAGAGRAGGGGGGVAAAVGAAAVVAVVAAAVYLRGGDAGGSDANAPGVIGGIASTGAGARWARAGARVSAPLLQNVSCTRRPVAEAVCGLPRTADRCARFVVDDAVPEGDARGLKSLVDWLVAEAWGGGAGPPSVVDLHQGSISYKEQFIELAALMEFKSITFTDEQKETYVSVRRSLRRTLSGLFGVPEESLLHDLTFFSHINGSKEAKTVHDEYWHLHTDTEQYGTFEYTALLYLSTQGDDFEGGEFVFEPSGEGGGKNVVVEPRFNRLVAFTSDAENPHRVEKVSRGVRVALTSAFTCDRRQAASIGPPFPPKRPETNEGEGDAESG